MTPAVAGALGEELAMRSVALNAAPVQPMRDYVLVWLQQTLRGRDHPTIDAAAALGNALGLPVLVYHGVRCDYPYASARLTRFIVGASAAMAQTLRARGIQSAHFVQRTPEHGKGLVYRLAARAAAVFVDEHFTFVAQAQSASFAAKADIACFATDATRSVPVRALPDKVGTTAAFRRGHGDLRATWLALRAEVEPRVTTPITGLPDELIDYREHSEATLDALVAGLAIDQSLPPSRDYRATRDACATRLSAVDARFVDRYASDRNNPAIDHGCSHLSPYLHFGMTSPIEIMRRVEALAVTSGARYKFYDELLTWREWSHWRLWRNRDAMRWATLPEWARTTLDAYVGDARDPLLDIDDLCHARTPDPLWNAAQRQWLISGWMHNNLRMYWSKGLIRWTRDPQTAWAANCYLNDKLSIDGRDPATYVSARWGFGEGRPGYRDVPVYGRIMPKASAPIMARDGMAAFVAHWLSRDLPQVDTSDFAVRRDDYR